MKKRLSDFINFSDLPADMVNMLNNLPNEGELALIEMYDRNSDFFKYAEPINIAKDFMTDDETTLFHYSTYENLKSIISGKKFWIKNKSYMNDPEEFLYTYNLCNELLKDIGANNVELNYFNEQIKIAPFDIYLWSFSSNADSQALWGNYGNKNGVAITVNTKKIMKALALHFSNGKKTLDEYNEENAFVFPLNVEYDKEKQKTRLSAILKQWLRAFRSFEYDKADMNSIIEQCLKALFLYATFFKNPLLYQEEEVRFIVINITYGNNPRPEFWHEKVPFVTCPVSENLLDGLIIQTGSGIQHAEIEALFKENGLAEIPISDSSLPY